MRRIKSSLAQGKEESLQADLRALELEAAKSEERVNTNEQEIKDLNARLEARSGAEEKGQLTHQLGQAKQRGDLLQKRASWCRGNWT